MNQLMQNVITNKDARGQQPLLELASQTATDYLPWSSLE